MAKWIVFCDQLDFPDVESLLKSYECDVSSPRITDNFFENYNCGFQIEISSKLIQELGSLRQLFILPNSSGISLVKQDALNPDFLNVNVIITKDTCFIVEGEGKRAWISQDTRTIKETKIKFHLRPLTEEMKALFLKGSMIEEIWQ